MAAQLFHCTDAGGGSFDVVDWIEAAKKADATMLSFAEYGGLQSTMRAYRKSKSAGIPYAPAMMMPFQYEFDKTKNFVDEIIVLVARDERSYLKLIEINNRIQREFFYRIPRFTLDMIASDPDPISDYAIDVHIPVHRSKIGELASMYGSRWFRGDGPFPETITLIAEIRSEISKFVPFFDKIYLDFPVTTDLLSGMACVGAARFIADNLGLESAERIAEMSYTIGDPRILSQSTRIDTAPIPDGFVVPIVTGYGSYPTREDGEVAATHRSLRSKFARTTALSGAYIRNASQMRGLLSKLMRGESDSVKDVFRAAMKNNLSYHESVEFSYETHRYEIPSISDEPSEVLYDKLIVDGWNYQSKRWKNGTYVGYWGDENAHHVDSIEDIFALDTKRSKRVQTEHDTFARLREDTGLDFQGYFLICWDIINFCDRNNLARNKAGRGSAPACLIGFLLGLFQIDPIDSPYYDDLPFERFINFARVKESKSLPDIDMDFSKPTRVKLMKYLKKKYGEERVVSISTLSRFKVPSAIQDLVGRNDGLVPNSDHPESYFLLDPSKCTQYPKSGKGSVPDMMRDREIKRIKVDSNAQEFLDYCADASEEFAKFRDKHDKWLSKCLVPACNMVSNNGTHASACIIVPGDIDRKVPIRINRDTLTPSVQFEMDDCEASGMVKLDLLGLNAASSIDTARNIVSKVYKTKPLDFRDIRFDDEKVFETLRQDPVGIFQLGSSLQIGYMKELKPTCFGDMVAALALIRTGPMKAGAHTKYAAIKNGLEEPEYDHPKLEPILSRSFGVLYLQEQIMKVSVDLAGFTAMEADELRRAAAKKKKDLMAKISSDFVEGCVRNGVDRPSAEEIWNKIEFMAEYLFNAAHSVSYAALAYEELYLKTYWPEALWCGIMEFSSRNLKQHGNLYAYKEHCESIGITIKPPTAGSFHHSFWAERGEAGAQDSIMWPVSGLRGIGASWAKKFWKSVGGSIDSFETALEAVDKQNGKKLLDLGKFKSLLFSGFFDEMFGDDPAESRVIAVKEFFSAGGRTGSKNERDMNVLIDIVSNELNYFKLNCLSWNCVQTPIKSTIGVQYGLEQDPAMFETFKNAYDSELVVASGLVESFRPHTDKKGNKMGFLKVVDKGEAYRVTLFADGYKMAVGQFGIPKPGDIVEIVGRKSVSDRYGDSVTVSGDGSYFKACSIPGWGEVQSAKRKQDGDK